jgi:putative ABC transport system permease protein
VTAEIALALVLLIGAGFFVQEFFVRMHARSGIDANQVLTAHIALSSSRYTDPSRQAAFFQEAIDRLQALPGVESVGATTCLVPGVENEPVVTFTIEGRPAVSRTERARTDYFAISPDYLRTLRIPLIRGRAFLPADTAHTPPVALVNQAFVERHFPKEEPVGKRVRLDTSGSDRPDWSEIVGVVGNVKNGFEGLRERPQIYEPYFQRPSSVMTLAVRTRADPAAFAPMLRRVVWGADKDQPITYVRTMDQVIAASAASGVMMNTLMGIFAGLGLALAAVGVFGVTAYTVAQRTREIGIRMALGARRGDVLGMVVRKGMVLGALGVGTGLVLAVPLVWLQLGLENDEVLPFDQRGPVFLAAVSLIGLAALLASYFPARRAAKVDPVVALRWE